ncbi:MAG: hypothetical protein WD992_01640 [Candidatus Levyibacteriota bacterium]
MSKNQIILSSMAMDLKRAALGYHRGSNTIADRFLLEAIKRKNEVDSSTVRPYLRKLLFGIDKLVKEKDTDRIAEDLLMYSTLFQNAALRP